MFRLQEAEVDFADDQRGQRIRFDRILTGPEQTCKGIDQFPGGLRGDEALPFPARVSKLACLVVEAAGNAQGRS